MRGRASDDLRIRLQRHRSRLCRLASPWLARILPVGIEAFPRAVLAHHYPDTPLHGDFTTIAAGQYDPIDLLVGGTPCQSFSIAGLRGGLDDDRGNLALEYLRLADRLRPRWLVWENVPGVLSSNGGRDFGAILGGMVELGYGVAYRVLDAQYAGVAQRRRRVFVVGYLGDWRRAAAVLFERHSLSGHPAPRREAGKYLAPTISARPTGGGGLGTDFDLDGGLVQAFGGNRTSGPVDVASALSALSAHGGPHGRMDFASETFVAHPIAFSAKDHGADAMSDLSPTLRAGGHSKSHANSGVMPDVAFSIMPMNSGKDFKGHETDVAQPVMAAGPSGGNQGGDYIVHPINPNALRGDSRAKTPSMDAAGVMRLRDPGLGIGADGDPADTLQAAGPGAVAIAATLESTAGRSRGAGTPIGMLAPTTAVRRLTPVECARLQGFPDDYLTQVPWRGKQTPPDGPMYKALGNSMCTNVMAWIGRRIADVDALHHHQKAA